MPLTHVLDACASLTSAQSSSTSNRRNCFVLHTKWTLLWKRVPTQSYFLIKIHCKTISILSCRAFLHSVWRFTWKSWASVCQWFYSWTNRFQCKGAILHRGCHTCGSYTVFFLLFEKCDVTRKLHDIMRKRHNLLLHNLNVQYQSVWDEALRHVALAFIWQLYAFDSLSTIPKHRPPLSRKWTLDKKAIAKIQKDAKRYTSLLKTCEIHVPSVFEFVDEVAFFVREPNILRHFRSLLSEVPNTIQIPEHSLDYKTMKQLVSKTSI